jgi:broad specificity phosphatase PhoE
VGQPDVATRWLLVRHGPTALARAGLYAGWSDAPLDAAARADATRLARRLAPDSLALAYTSDLPRARQTLDLLLEGRPPPPVRPDRDLRELHFGTWEGLSYAAIAAQVDGPAVLAGERPAPGGESLADLAARVERFGARLRRESPAGSAGAVLVVAHGGPLRVLLCHLLGLPPAAQWRFRIDHTSLSEVLWDPHTGPLVVSLNDRCHLLDRQRRRGERGRDERRRTKDESASVLRPSSSVPARDSERPKPMR